MKAYVNYILNNILNISPLDYFVFSNSLSDKINAMEKYFEFKITRKELCNFKV